LCCHIWSFLFAPYNLLLCHQEHIHRSLQDFLFSSSFFFFSNSTKVFNKGPPQFKPPPFSLTEDIFFFFFPEVCSLLFSPPSSGNCTVNGSSVQCSTLLPFPVLSGGFFISVCRVPYLFLTHFVNDPSRMLRVSQHPGIVFCF